MAELHQGTSHSTTNSQYESALRHQLDSSDEEGHHLKNPTQEQQHPVSKTSRKKGSTSVPPSSLFVSGRLQSVAPPLLQWQQWRGLLCAMELQGRSVVFGQQGGDPNEEAHIQVVSTLTSYSALPNTRSAQVHHSSTGGVFQLAALSARDFVNFWQNTAPKPKSESPPRLTNLEKKKVVVVKKSSDELLPGTTSLLLVTTPQRGASTSPPEPRRLSSAGMPVQLEGHRQKRNKKKSSVMSPPSRFQAVLDGEF